MAETITISTGEPLHVDCGSLRFTVRRREVGSDGGHSIALYGPKGGEDEEALELIRFDLFRNDPHYHVPASQPKPTSIRAEAPGAALEFALGAIRDRLPALLDEAGHPDFAREAEALALSEIAEQVRQATARAPEPSETTQFPLTAEARKALGME